MEIPEEYLEQARDNKVESLADGMLSGENGEWLWAEIERMTLSKDREDIDALEDMSIKDIAVRVAEQVADRMMQNGDLDEDAMECAQGAAESYYEGDR